MKKLFVLALAAFCFSALAGQEKPSASGTSINAQQGQQQQATSDATNSGVTQNITFAAEDQTVRSQADKDIAGINAAVALEIARINSEAKIRNTPSVSGPALTSSNDTCMGSSSGSVNAPGIGISLGSTWVDENCKMLKNSRELWNMGMKAASLALMCNDAANKAALELTGFECPQTTAAKKASAPVAAEGVGLLKPVAGYTGNDPIVLQRMAGK